jgi:hypothetical protein
MIQCSKEFAMPTEFMQHHFTKRAVFNDWTSDWYAYYLPNGWIHNYGNKPAITLSDGTELRCEYGVVPDLPHILSAKTLTLHNVKDFSIKFEILRDDAICGINAMYDGETQMTVERQFPPICKKIIEMQECKCNIL